MRLHLRERNPGVVIDSDVQELPSNSRSTAPPTACDAMPDNGNVPGMAEAYDRWSKAGGVTFHYVSASPWQLFAPLEGFVRSNGFPAGSFNLKSFRWKDRSFFDLFKSPGVAETLDWAAALSELDVVALDPATVSDTLGVLLKYQDDIARLEGSKVKELLDEVKSELRAAE